MRNRYIITEENAKEIKEYRKKIKDKKKDRRMYAVQLVGEGMKYQMIAEKLDCKVQQVGVWVKKYAEHGIEGLNPKLGGRRHENMTLEEEKDFLEQFGEIAEAGQIVEVSEIKKAYDKLIGHETGHGQIYNVLHRHGWRKTKPRSRHPKKASEELVQKRISSVGAVPSCQGVQICLRSCRTFNRRKFLPHHALL